MKKLLTILSLLSFSSSFANDFSGLEIIQFHCETSSARGFSPLTIAYSNVTTHRGNLVSSGVNFYDFDIIEKDRELSTEGLSFSFHNVNGFEKKKISGELTIDFAESSEASESLVFKGSGTIELTKKPAGIGAVSDTYQLRDCVGIIAPSQF